MNRVTTAFFVFLLALLPLVGSAQTVVEGSGANPAKIGESVEGDGMQMTINSVTRTDSPNSYTTAGEGETYIILDVTIRNVGDEEVSYNTLDFAAKDMDTGKTYDDDMMAAADNALNSGDLAVGDIINGTVVMKIDDSVVNLRIKYDVENFFLGNDTEFFWLYTEGTAPTENAIVATEPAVSTFTPACIFGDNWDVNRVGLGSHIDAFNTVFGQYALPQDEFDVTLGILSYDIPNCATLSVNTASTGEIVSIDVWPANTAHDVGDTMDDDDAPLFTLGHAQEMVIGFLPADAQFNGDVCIQQPGPTTFAFGYSPTLTNLSLDVYTEAQGADNNGIPTHGGFGIIYREALFGEELPLDNPNRIEVVTISTIVFEPSGCE